MISILLAHPPINLLHCYYSGRCRKKTRSPRLCLKVNNHIHSVRAAFKTKLVGKSNKANCIKSLWTLKLAMTNYPGSLINVCAVFACQSCNFRIPLYMTVSQLSVGLLSWLHHCLNIIDQSEREIQTDGSRTAEVLLVSSDVSVRLACIYKRLNLSCQLSLTGAPSMFESSCPVVGS